VSDENIPESVNCDAGAQELLCGAVTTVDQVRNVVDQQQRRRITAAGFTDAWSTFGAEQDEARGIA